MAAAVLAAAMSGCDSQPTTQKLDVAAVAAGSSTYQKEVLSDGHVSPEEYEKAVLASRDCISSAGGNPGEITKMPGNQLGFDTSITAQNETEGRKIEAAMSDCNAEYIFAISQVWSYQEMISPEQKDMVRPKVVECLNQTGLNLDENASQSDIQTALERTSDETQRQAAVKCIQKFPEFFQTVPQS